MRETKLKIKLLPPHRDFRNVHEGRFAKLAGLWGWEVTKRGWPDFFCVKPDGSVAVVEVKPPLKWFGRRRGGGLSKVQTIVLIALARHGIDCYVNDGSVLKPFDPEFHARRIGLGLDADLV